jgi:hypothetical protein
MRISTLPNDPYGYSKLQQLQGSSRDFRVFLNGDQIRKEFVLIADEEAGFVTIMCAGGGLTRWGRVKIKTC